MQNTLNKTKSILNKYNIKAEKRYGQNFLIDDNILDDIVSSSNITNEDLVIEIGPGLGNLTEYLLPKAGFSLLIEIDSKMINILTERFSDFNNYELLNEDVLKIDIDKLIDNIEIKNNKKYSSVKVVANLPYYITTPIIFKLLQDSNRINEIIVMVQKEVAERMVAKPKSKDYGILTLMVQYYALANIELIVPNNSFIPAPDVTSAVIQLKKYKRYEVRDEDLLFKLIHSSFAQRRKKMINSLESCNFANKDKKSIEELFRSLNIDSNTRAEELEMEKYIQIVEEIKR